MIRECFVCFGTGIRSIGVDIGERCEECVEGKQLSSEGEILAQLIVKKMREGLIFG